MQIGFKIFKQKFKNLKLNSDDELFKAEIWQIKNDHFNLSLMPNDDPG